jgi:predicted regulator of Ras-like GTPase activity (Roadblock/LC7/MglB family)
VSSEKELTRSGEAAVTELDWLLERLTLAVGGVRYAVILSPDGFTLGRSPGVTDEAAEHLAALAAALHSLARGAGQRFGTGDVNQTIVEMQGALLFITPAGRGTCLALLAESSADAGHIAYEMAVLIKRVGQHMIANPRFPVQDPVAW